MSEPLLNDWIRESSTTEGTGDFTLDGAVPPNNRAFNSLYVAGNTFFYTIRHRAALECESGIGALTAGGEVARNTVLESTNSNTLVDFSEGTKDVYISPIATMFPSLLDGEIWVGVTGSVVVPSSAWAIQVVTFGLALGTPATVGNNKTNEITMPYDGTIVRARARCKTAPTGSALVFDINLNGTTIWATQANRLQIATSVTTGTQSTFDTTAFVDGDVVTIDQDQVGSTVAGQDITVQLEVAKAG